MALSGNYCDPELVVRHHTAYFFAVPGQRDSRCIISANANAQALLAAGIFPGSYKRRAVHGGNNSPTSVKEEIARIDHQFTDKFSVFGHWISEQISQTYGTTQWSGDNVPTVSDVFGNPSYSAVIHTTYVISPTLLNEAAFNYNGNRIHIIPQGLVHGAFRLYLQPAVQRTQRRQPHPVDQPEWQHWNQLHCQLDAVEQQGRRLSIPRRHFLDQGRAPDQNSGASWAIYKKVQDAFANTKEISTLTADSPATTLPIFCSATLSNTPRMRSRSAGSGTTFPMRLMFRTTGAQPIASL